VRRGVAAILAIALAAAAPSPARACDNSPDLASIPGATPEAAQRRYDAYDNDLTVIARIESEKSALEQSSTIYLATVDKVTRGASRNSDSVLILRPVWLVRGQLPKGLQRLQLPYVGSSCPGRGYLPLSDKPGNLLIVFNQPSCQFAISAEVARTDELIRAITMYALKVDPAQFSER